MTRDELYNEIAKHTEDQYKSDMIITAVDEYTSALLRQCNCYTALELLKQELNKLDGVITYGSVHAAINIAIDKKSKVLSAMDLIKELQANAV